MTDSKLDNKKTETPNTVEADKTKITVPPQPQPQGEMPKAEGPQQQAKA